MNGRFDAGRKGHGWQSRGQQLDWADSLIGAVVSRTSAIVEGAVASVVIEEVVVDVDADP